MAAPHTPPLLDAALAWHDAGVCVLPAAADGSKRPAVPWAGYQRQRSDVVDLTAWLGGITPAHDGIGIVCGAVSGGLEMFELEGAAVADGLHLQLRDLFHAVGLPGLWDKLQTYVEMSPAGGLHWIYRVDGSVPGNTKLARRRADGAVQVLMETRGEGGWVVVAPSAGRTHPTGKAWMVLPGSTPGRVPTLTVDEHQTLHRLARTFDMVESVTVPVEPVAPPRTPGERTPGDVYNQSTDWADILVPAGWTLVYTRAGGTRAWRRPGKNVGISATTGYGDQGHDLLYVFTTSTEFESERSYSKLGAHAVLHCGGDHSRAASELRRMGYGDPSPAQERTNPLTLVYGEGGEASRTTDSDSGQLNEADPPAAWAPVDLGPHLDGTYVPLKPSLLRRTDGLHLLYPGRVHSLHGESESGKSWIGLWAIAEQLVDGKRAAMIDFESDAHTVVGRLIRLGVPRHNIRELFQYRNPDVNPNAVAREFTEWAALLGQQFEVILIDGVTEALTVFTVSSKDNDEVTSWIRAVPRRLARSTGAAVVMVDHVTKDSESRGRFAIGGQAKMAALDGAAYMVEVLEPMGLGLVGKVALRVAKDRNGSIRPASGPLRKSDQSQETAIVVVDSSTDDITTITVGVPRADGQGGGGGFQPTKLMQRVSEALEKANACMSRTAIKATVTGKNEFVLQAIDCLLADGYVAEDGPSLNGGKPTIRLLRPYREDGSDPSPDLDPMDLVPDPASPTRTRPLAKDQGTGGRVDSGPGTRPRGRVGDGSGTGSQMPLDLGAGESDD